MKSTFWKVDIKKRNKLAATYISIQDGLYILLHRDVQITLVRDRSHHRFHIHILSSHHLKLFLHINMRKKKRIRTYHKLHLVVFRLGINVVLEEFSRSALHISTILFVIREALRYHDLMHQLVDKCCIFANTALGQRTNVLLFVTISNLILPEEQLQFWREAQDRT